MYLFRGATIQPTTGGEWKFVLDQFQPVNSKGIARNCSGVVDAGADPRRLLQAEG